MKNDPPKVGVLRRSLKTSFTMLARAMWRGGVRPILGMLPQHWDARIRTLAHYSKLTLVHGETLDFSKQREIPFHGWPEASAAALPTPQQPSGDDEPSQMLATEAPVLGKPILPARRSAPQILPDWIVSELRELAKIEPELTPTEQLIDDYHVYHTPMALEPARVYAQCADVIARRKPDLIILVPYLVRGGADLGVLHHVRAAMGAGMRVAVIATLDADSPWKEKLPEGCPLIEYGKLAAGLDVRHRKTVLARLLIDAPAQVIHIVNAYLGWEVLQRNGKSLVSTGKRIYASTFSDGRDANGVLWSFPRFFFVDCWRYLSGVVSDSRWYPDELVRQYGIPRSRLHTVYFPGPQIPSPPVCRAVAGGSVLWASRITHSKRPDLLAAIARAAPDIEFSVFGYAADDDDRRLEKGLAKIPNIKLHGKFDSLDEVIGAGAYSAFLYTTAWDGLPNVLLEATASGLPVVASALCGIPEFIDEESGYPVAAVEDPAAYVARIREIIASPECARRKWESACRRLREQHGETAFIENLRRVPGYLATDIHTPSASD